MRVTRRDLKRRIVARLWVTPFHHPVLRAIDSLRGSDRQVRSLALAITRTELECRRLPVRIFEYLYVSLGAPRFHRVTVGPAQIQWDLLLSAHARSCGCAVRARCILLPHVLDPRVYSRCVVEIVRSLWDTLRDARSVANAYTKGTGARDLSVATMYSEVVLDLCRRYDALA